MVESSFGPSNSILQNIGSKAGAERSLRKETVPVPLDMTAASPKPKNSSALRAAFTMSLSRTSVVASLYVVMVLHCPLTAPIRPPESEKSDRSETAGKAAIVFTRPHRTE